MLTRIALAALVLTAACRDSVSPERGDRAAPQFAVADGTGIVLNQRSGTLNEYDVHLGIGFDPVNPHLGDAIVATFFWLGTTNTIVEVTDLLADDTPVGNHYELVEYVTAGGVSMATYVAINVQNFPDPNPGSSTALRVRATFPEPVRGGVLLSAYSGVESVSAAALGAHASASGSGESPTVAAPGAIPVDAGALTYAVTMSDGIAGTDPPPGFTNITTMSDDVMAMDAVYAVQDAAGPVDPQWTWYFDSPHSWLASAVALNPAPAPPPPPPPSHLVFVTQPSRTLPLMTISPPVQVAAVDDQGNTATEFTGSVTIAIGQNGGLLLPGTLSGTRTVTAVGGIATFSDLSIDQLGNGYTLTVSSPDLLGAESAPFNIGLGIGLF